jgi:hypothetical protein
MAQNKTQASSESVEAYLAAIEDETRRNDCEALADLFERVTGEPAVMWGSAIVGYGSYHYKYESGREGDSCRTGFAARKGDISIYLGADFPDRTALLARLGRHKMGKACLYIRKLNDVDVEVLAQLVAGTNAVHRPGK